LLMKAEIWLSLHLR